MDILSLLLGGLLAGGKLLLGLLWRRDPEKERLKQDVEATREEAKELSRPAGPWADTVDKL